MAQDTVKCFTYEEILHNFARLQGNLDEASPLSAEEVKEDFFLADKVRGPVALIWRFNDDSLSEHSPAPALAFQKCAGEAPDHGNERYRLAYVDPSIRSLWKEVERDSTIGLVHEEA